MHSHLERTPPWIIHVALIVLVLAVYAQVYRFEFTNFDDEVYVYDNAHVTRPFNWEDVRWAFTSGYYNNWHPLTWLAHKLDYQLFGLNAGAHHLGNVLFHLLNTLLLFEALRRMGPRGAGPRGAMFWRSAMVAALFAVHPLHVGSVGWISERKDVMSTFFAFVALWGYVRYVQRPGLTRYLLIFVAFALGLMSKSMVVTLPCVLLLLDWWPLNRFEDTSGVKARLIRGGALLIEKLPLFALALADGLVAMVLKSDQVIPASERLPQVPISYVRYVGKTFWPFQLAAHYPYPRELPPMWHTMAALLVLAAITLAAFALARRKPYLLMGWLWFVGTMLPASGLIQAGNNVMADRYMYIPIVGLFIACVWGAADIASRLKIPRIAIAGAAGALLVALSAAAYVQVGYWRNTTTLFEHTIQVVPDNCLAHYNLGALLLEQQRYPEAAQEFWYALQADPNDVESIAEFGIALSALGRTDDAIRLFHGALALDPHHVNSQINLGVTLTAKGQYAEAESWLANAVALSPDNADALYNLGLAQFKQGKFAEAAAQCAEAVRLRPEFVEALYCMGLALTQQGKSAEAANCFSRVLQLEPSHTGARQQLQTLTPAR